MNLGMTSAQTYEVALGLTEFLILFSVALQAVENFFLLQNAKGKGFQLLIGIIIIILIFFKSFEIWFLLFLAQIISLSFLGTNLNGGSDAMTIISLVSVTLMRTEIEFLQKIGVYYLSVQVILSYFVAGIVKLKEKNWRTGDALGLFLKESFYRESLISLFLQHKKIIRPAALFMLFWEISFPMLLFFPDFTLIYLIIGFVFHLINAFVFGIHRFFWTWIATYPLLWFFLTQAR